MILETVEAAIAARVRNFRGVTEQDRPSTSYAKAIRGRPMNRTELTIVMYHYVRDLARTRYPAIKGRDLSSFRRQLDYIARHHSVVRAEEVVAAISKREPLPDNAAWLTFDDGYIDHYSVVFPLFARTRLAGIILPTCSIGAGSRTARREPGPLHLGSQPGSHAYHQCHSRVYRRPPRVRWATSLCGILD